MAWIAGDDDAAGAKENGQGFFEAALAGFVEEDDIEDGFAGEDLGDGGGTGHPDGAEVEERVAVGSTGAGGDHLAEFEGALAADEEALSEGGAEGIEAGAGGSEESIAPTFLPLMEDECADLARLEFGEFAEFVEGGFDALGIDAGEGGLGLDSMAEEIAESGGLECGEGLVGIELGAGGFLEGGLDGRGKGGFAGDQPDGVFEGVTLVEEPFGEGECRMAFPEMGGPFLPGRVGEETGGEEVLFEKVKLIGAPGGFVEGLDQPGAVCGVAQAIEDGRSHRLSGRRSDQGPEFVPAGKVVAQGNELGIGGELGRGAEYFGAEFGPGPTQLEG